MAKKTVSKSKKKTASKAKKAEVVKNFVVLTGDMTGSCCGARFATAELAQAEATKHLQDDFDGHNTGWDNSYEPYYIAQLVSKVTIPKEHEVPVVIETL